MSSSRRVNNAYTYISLSDDQSINQSTITDRFSSLKLIDWLIIIGSIVFVASIASILSIIAVSYLDQSINQSISRSINQSINDKSDDDNASIGSDSPIEGFYYESVLSPSIDQNRDPNQCWNNDMFTFYKSGELYNQSLLSINSSPISQSTNQTIHPSISPSINQTINQSTKQSINPYTLADVLILITTSSQFHRSRCDVIMCTWARELPVYNVMFVSDSEDSLLPLINVLAGQRILNSKEDTNNVTTQGWKAAYTQGKKRSIKFYLRIDDDTFVSPANLLRFINRIDHREPAFYGQVCDVSSSRRTGWNRICGGGGELLTVELLDLIHPWFFDECDPFNHTPHDVFLPRCIVKRTGIQPIDAREFNSELPDFFYTTWAGIHARPHGFGQAITFHYVRPASKYMTLYALYQAFK